MSHHTLDVLSYYVSAYYSSLVAFRKLALSHEMIFHLAGGRVSYLAF